MVLRLGAGHPFNENILRVPGHSLRRAQNSNAFDALTYMLVVLMFPLLGYSTYKSGVSNVYVILVPFVLITGWFFYKAIRTFKIAIRLHQALDAETTTGQELNLLMRDSAWVFHDIECQYGNIDHVIVSTGGVFAVETKGISKPTNNKNTSSDNATVRVEREQLVLPHAKSSQPITQAKRNAKWLRNEILRRFVLDVPVRAVVALPGWMIKGGFDGDCWVVNPKRGNSLRGAVTKQLISEKETQIIAAWVEDLARSVKPKSKEFDKKPELSF